MSPGVGVRCGAGLGTAPVQLLIKTLGRWNVRVASRCERAPNNPWALGSLATGTLPVSVSGTLTSAPGPVGGRACTGLVGRACRVGASAVYALPGRGLLYG
jgi:hypothetical protein